MLRVGLTGGIAAGKSTVARRMDVLGAVVIDADVIAREVVEPGTPGFDAVVAEFGTGVVGADGGLDRPALGRLVFGDDDRRRALNAIVHPLVYARRQELVDTAPADAIVVEDVPLIVENDLGPAYHLVVVVHAPAEERVRRLVADRGMAEADARARVAAQATDDERRAAADVWLDNVGPRAAVESRVDDLWTGRLVPFEDNLRNRRPAHRDASSTAPVPFDPTWAVQARRLAARLARVAGDRASRIDHVGPTSVRGEAAVDVISLEVAVADRAAAMAVARDAPEAGFVALPAQSSAAEVMLSTADPKRPADARLHWEADGTAE